MMEHIPNVENMRCIGMYAILTKSPGIRCLVVNIEVESLQLAAV